MEKVLPKGWVETELLNLLQTLETGIRPKGGVQGILEGVPSIGGEHLTSDGGFNFKNIKYVPKEFAEKLLRGRILHNDVLIVKDGATTGKTSFVGINFPFDTAFVNEHVFICRPYKEINPKVVYYFMRSKDGQERIMVNFAGAAQGGINTKFASNTLIPLPPLPEQERMVAKLDKLFAQHEKIKKALDRIPQLLKAFRQQVLTQAVENKKGTTKLKEFLIDIKYGTSKKSEYGISGTPILRIPNIENGGINDKDLKYSVLDEKEYNTLRLRENDILIIRSNGSVSLVGQSAIISSKHENYSYAGYLIRIRLNENYDAGYLNYIFKSNFIRSQMIDTSRSTSGVNNINSKEIQELDIPDLEVSEQQEIVRRVESLFAKADTIEARYQKLKEKVDNLPQVILHKAFRGELVPQLPTDGDAKDLLQEILALKKESKGKRGKA
ncbi:restriction endonuclease subunit S [Olivibacter sp. SDN3]|uniref:restriction endonuclease subunit S n=1 Tax=Olivibacter sp. SDN3 TaxID=2764720 RepID=UPI001651206C|nr:restriction endonuclease subunit S [Olivibacter sp. SDN3]QNL48952.1 restriction endonuclease subunit S [Olivibacter sp. SDN3]